MKDHSYAYSTFFIEIKVKNEILTYARNVSKFFDLISNIGGFSDGLVFLTAWLVVFYNSKVFEMAIMTENFRVQRPKNKFVNKNRN